MSIFLLGTLESHTVFPELVYEEQLKSEITANNRLVVLTLGLCAFSAHRMLPRAAELLKMTCWKTLFTR